MSFHPHLFRVEGDLDLFPLVIFLRRQRVAVLAAANDGAAPGLIGEPGRCLAAALEAEFADIDATEEDVAEFDTSGPLTLHSPIVEPETTAEAAAPGPWGQSEPETVDMAASDEADIAATAVAGDDLQWEPVDDSEDDDAAERAEDDLSAPLTLSTPVDDMPAEAEDLSDSWDVADEASLEVVEEERPSTVTRGPWAGGAPAAAEAEEDAAEVWDTTADEVYADFDADADEAAELDDEPPAEAFEPQAAEDEEEAAEEAGFDAAVEWDEAEDLDDAAEAEIAAAPVADLPAEPRADEAVIDEDMLREMVAQLVRDELQGAVGERITHNVRRLIRREIARALTLQELEK